MPVKIRLQRHGRKKRPFYHIIVADSRNKRDGRFIERIGDYNPLTVPATINLDVEKAFKWVMNGAQPTDTVRKILTFKGVLYKKHLQRGVVKGAFSQEEADNRFNQWVEEKHSKIQQRIEKEFQKIADKKAKRDADEANKRSAKLIAKEEALKEQEKTAEEQDVDSSTENSAASEVSESKDEVIEEATENQETLAKEETEPQAPEEEPSENESKEDESTEETKEG